MVQIPANPDSAAPEDHDLDLREDSRDSLLLVAELTADQLDGPRKVKVRNLSAGGMMADADFVLPPQTSVVVTLRNIGPVSGTVAWAQDSRFGIEFAADIDPRLARNAVGGGEKEAPVYARPSLSAPKHDGWNGKLRKV